GELGFAAGILGEAAFAAAAEAAGSGGIGEAIAAEETGTVWDAITATQDVYEGTVIPRSFILETEGADVWVAPNATEHLPEYVYTRLEKEAVTSFSTNIWTQMQLNSLRTAVGAATSEGVAYGIPLKVGAWELVFSPARLAG